MKRLFVAVKINLSADLLRVYYGLKKDLALEKIKWVEENNFHLTLKFIGNTNTSLINNINSALESVALVVSPFEMNIGEPGIFGSRYNPRVIWLGIEKNLQMESLADKVLDTLDKAGFPRDRQNFVPHLTIGRIKHIHNKKYLKEVIDKYRGEILQSVIIDKFFLYESILKREGPVYKIISEFSLK